MGLGLLLPAFYLPNVSYFHVIKSTNEPVCLEQFEHFQKQSFRTRTHLATANGVLDLIIPIIHGKKDRVKAKDVRINYDHPWQRQHWLSMQTAYRSSAYFEFYEDYLAPFYHNKYEFLFDYNLQQLQLMLKLLKIDREIILSDSYQDVEGIDYRTAIHAKKPSLIENQRPYYQIFEDKIGFLPNVSIIDLLFSQGPQAKNFL